MAEGLKFQSYTEAATSVIFAAITIAVAYGIGYYVVVKLNESTNNSMTAAIGILDAIKSPTTSVVTLLMILVIAFAAFGLINYIRKQG